MMRWLMEITVCRSFVTCGPTRRVSVSWHVVETYSTWDELASDIRSRGRDNPLKRGRNC